MAELSASAPLHAAPSTLSAAREGGRGSTPVGVADETARIFSNQLAELNRLQRSAQQSGEVVTEADIRLEFEMRGALIAARAGQTEFASRAPLQTPVETLRAMQARAPEKPQAEKPETDDETPAAASKLQPGSSRSVHEMQALMAEKVAALNQSLAHAPQPTTGKDSGEPPALDAQA
ncbi:MAG: hypothetical protein HUU35_17040 [Armatimonadetes bacterium]|nr:hypothetical protein [Armatimonadota bacterium]